MISNKLYNWLKWLGQIVLPAQGVLLFLVSQTWGLKNATDILGIVMIIDLVLGILLVISQNIYNQHIETAGELIIKRDGKLLFQLDEAKTDLAKLREKKEVYFKVEKVDT